MKFLGNLSFLLLKSRGYCWRNSFTGITGTTGVPYLPIIPVTFDPRQKGIQKRNANLPTMQRWVSPLCHKP
jgi:hypothetical protein